MQVISAKQIFDRLSPYDLSRVTLQMTDGMPVVAVYIETDETGGTTVTLSDQTHDSH